MRIHNLVSSFLSIPAFSKEPGDNTGKIAEKILKAQMLSAVKRYITTVFAPIFWMANSLKALALRISNLVTERAPVRVEDTLDPIETDHICIRNLPPQREEDPMITDALRICAEYGKELDARFKPNSKIEAEEEMGQDPTYFDGFWKNDPLV